MTTGNKAETIALDAQRVVTFKERGRAPYVFVFRRITAQDFDYAHQLGHTIRLVGAATQTERGLILSVRPALIWARSPPSSTRCGRSCSSPQLALRWTLSNPVISTALVGCRNPREVDDNAGAIGWSISDADMKEIDAVFARHGAITMPETWLETV